MGDPKKVVFFLFIASIQTVATNMDDIYCQENVSLVSIPYVV